MEVKRAIPKNQVPRPGTAGAESTTAGSAGAPMAPANRSGEVRSRTVSQSSTTGNSNNGNGTTGNKGRSVGSRPPPLANMTTTTGYYAATGQATPTAGGRATAMAPAVLPNGFAPTGYEGVFMTPYGLQYAPQFSRVPYGYSSPSYTVAPSEWAEMHRDKKGR